VIATLKVIGITYHSTIEVMHNGQPRIERLITGKYHGADQWLFDSFGNVFLELGIDPNNFTRFEFNKILRYHAEAIDFDLSDIERSISSNVIIPMRKNIKTLYIASLEGGAHQDMLTNELIGETMLQLVTDAKMQYSQEPPSERMKMHVELHQDYCKVMTYQIEYFIDIFAA
jgi:hypothetical protein